MKSKAELSDDSSGSATAKSSQAQLKAAAEKLPKILKAEEKAKTKETVKEKSKKKNKEEKKDEPEAKKDDDTNVTGVNIHTYS